MDIGCGKGVFLLNYSIINENSNILGIEKDATGTFNVGTGIQTDIINVFNNLKKLFNSEIPEIHSHHKMGEQKRSCLDYGKINLELGWQPEYDLELGLEKTKQWFKNNNSVNLELSEHAE